MIKWIKHSPIALVFAVLLLAPHGSARASLDDGIYAIFETSIGVITAELHYVEAPMAVASFIGLAEGTRNWRDERNGQVHMDPFYDGTIVNRITSLANQPTNFDTYIVQAGTLNTGSGSAEVGGDHFGIQSDGFVDLGSPIRVKGRYTHFGHHFK